jgi:hypothetical protein
MADARPAEMMVALDMFRTISGAGAGEIVTLIRSRQITVRDGRVSLVAATRAFLDHIRATTRNASLTGAQAEARSARAEASELALAVETGLLVADTVSDEAVTYIAGAVLREFASLPAIATRDVRERRMIESLLYHAQTALAASIADAEPVLSDAPTKAKSKGKTR